MNDYSISVSFVANLLKIATHYGANAQTLCQAANIEITQLNNPNFHVPISQYKKLMQHAKLMTKKDDIALLLGQLNHLTAPTIIDLIMESSADMNEAFNQLQRYNHLILNEADI